MDRLWLKLKNFVIAVLLFFTSILIGTVGFMHIENMSFADSFFMSVIIMSTTGMNEVKQLSPEGRVFVTFFIIFNLIVLGYLVSVVTKYIFEGELRDVFQHYLKTRKATKMKNHTILCGCGKNGSKAAEELFRSGLPFVIVERKRDSIPPSFHHRANIFIVEGDATADESLTEAGIHKAKTIITTLPEDADNVFVTLTAKEMNPQIHIISRATNESSVRKLYRAGAHHVVLPDSIGGLHMASLVTRPEVIEFLNILNGMGTTEVRLEEVKVNTMKTNMKNKSIRELDIRNLTGVNVIGYKDSDGFMFNPTPETEFEDGGVVIILGTDNDIRTFLSYCSSF